MKRFGILQTGLPARGSKQSSLSTYVPSATWRLFHQAGTKYQIQVLFFRTEDVEFSKRRVHAWSCSSNDGMSGWKRSWHPLPDVVYENYPMGVQGGGPGVMALKRQFIQNGIPTFNPILFDKAALDRILRNSSQTRSLLPPSKTVQRVSDVVDFLKLYGVVFLKPVNGSQGTGILQIESLSSGKVRVRSDKFQRNQGFDRIFSAAAFEDFIAKLIKQRRYLVQKGLKLLQQNGKKIDFRVVVHRGADGKWYSAGIRPKLGKLGAIVTNSHAGGTKTTWKELDKWAKQHKVKLPGSNQLDLAAIAAAERLTVFRPTLSHLGIDIGVDQSGNVYVLDINIRPGRDLLTRAMLLKVTDLTAGFASYLARRKSAVMK